MTAPFPGTLPALFVTSVLGETERRGVRAAALLAGTGVSPESLSDPEAPLPVTAIFAVWEAAMRRLRDDALPVTVARTFSLEHYPVLGFAVMTAATVREAVARVLRFSAILTTSSRWTMEERGDVVHMRWHRDGPRTLGHRVANESAMAEFVHAARQLVGTDVPVLKASFRHPAPPDVRAHRAHFGGALSWAAEIDELVLPSALLDRVPWASNPALSAHFERQAARALAQSAEDAPLATRVRHAVERALPSGEPATSRIARELAMSERTFRRALAAEGTSFRDIVDATRRDRADVLLADGRASLAEIALSLGFSELSAFSRAFKRWTGRSPKEARSLATTQRV